MKAKALVFICILAGCGGGNDGTSDADSNSLCTNAHPGILLLDDNLCKLSCHSTTREQAISLLGSPSMSSETSIDYQYTCVNKDSSVDSLLISIFFFNDTPQLGDLAGTLQGVQRIASGSFASGELPSCLGVCGQ